MINGKTTYVSDALGNLIEVLKYKAKVSAVITALVEQLQELDNEYISLSINRWLNNAEGVQLDGIGDIIGELREGWSDADYLNALKTRIVILLGNGTTNDIIQLVTEFIDDMVVEIVDDFPAGFILKLKSPVEPSFDANKLKSYIIKVKPLGVRFTVEFFVVGPFQYDMGLGYDVGKYGGVV